jgi:small subunit ribosomal protein S18
VPDYDRRRHRTVCSFCLEHVDHIDYKEVSRLRRYLTDRAKILPRRMTGTCARHQRLLTVALKRARHMALLPFTADVR